MRIVQVCSEAGFGGGERHLVDLARAMVGRGHEVHAAAIPGSPLHAELSFLAGGDVHKLSPSNYVKNVAGLARFIRSRGIEIVHAHAARDYHLAALALKLARRGRLILTRHALFPLRRANRYILGPVARVIAVSHAVADSLRDSGVVEPSKIVVVHNGVDTARFARARARGSYSELPPFMVGTVGHLAPIKGHEEFVRAAALILARRGGVTFTIVGEDKSPGGVHRRRIERLIGELGVSANVSLAGWRDDMAEVLSTFTVFVSAARSEPFGLAIIEAMAAGLPIVATASEGAREIIDDGVSGRLVPVGDERALAAAICDLLGDPAERCRLRGNALRLVRERYTLERMAADVERIYRHELSVP